MDMDTNRRQEIIERIRALPARLEMLTRGLTDAQLTAAFEPGEWTVAQNVHHVFDVHTTFYARCKLIVIEDTPPLANLAENAWAELPDAKEAQVTSALAGIAYVQHRLAVFLENLDATAWQREGMHTERGAITVASVAEYAATHGEMHIAQIRKTLTVGGIAGR